MYRTYFSELPPPGKNVNLYIDGETNEYTVVGFEEVKETGNEFVILATKEDYQEFVKMKLKPINDKKELAKQLKQLL